MQDRFVLITDGTLEPRRFPIADMHDRYHRVKCYATSWTQGEALTEYLNRGSRDLNYWDQLAADLKTAPARGYRPCNEDYVDQLRRELDAETAANATEASQNDAEHPGWGS